MTVSIVGLDTAKSVFQVHGVDAGGRVELKRRLQRSEVVAFFERLPRCTIVMEACASAHHWGRVLGRLGHEVRLIAPEAVRPFVKRGKKNDAADAAAIVVAASRPDTKFVAVKSSEQQGVLALHSARALLVKQQTMLANAMRSLAAEFGLVGPKGTWRLEELATLLEADEEVPEPARRVFADLLEQFHILADRIGVLEAAIVTQQVRQRAALRSLARTGTAAALQRWPDAARADHEGRQSGDPAVAGARCDFDDLPGRRLDQRSRRLGAKPAGATPSPARDSRPGQQDGAYRLGGAGTQRRLSAERAARSSGHRGLSFGRTGSGRNAR
jgi:transposase